MDHVLVVIRFYSSKRFFCFVARSEEHEHEMEWNCNCGARKDTGGKGVLF